VTDLVRTVVRTLSMITVLIIFVWVQREVLVYSIIIIIIIIINDTHQNILYAKS